MTFNFCLHFNSLKSYRELQSSAENVHLLKVLSAKSNFSFHLVATCLALAKSTNKALVVLPVYLCNKRYSRVKAGGVGVDTFVITMTTSATQGFKKKLTQKKYFC